VTRWRTLAEECSRRDRAHATRSRPRQFAEFTEALAVRDERGVPLWCRRAAEVRREAEERLFEEFHARFG
jgi:hypothetical protein